MQKFTKAIAAIMLTVAVVCAVGCTKSDDTNNNGNNNEGNGANNLNGHEYVDLGLPSGTLWATCNVGAETPDDYGYYFAWGEIQPKDNYRWSTYLHCNGSDNTLTKYCNNPDYGYNGFTDSLSTLLPEDDAVAANWGDRWFMPTEEQWRELYRNTTHVWTKLNDVKGCLFTASNGVKLFLPAAGFRSGFNFLYTGNEGCYWSSSHATHYLPQEGYISNFFFEPENYGMGAGRRDYGQSVRGVCSSRQK